MKLRSHLFLMALCVLAPMAALATLGAVLLVQHERKTMERDAIGRARASMSAVDAELRGHVETALALAASKSLETGDIRAFHEESVRVLRSQRHWLNIGLASASGLQLSDAVLPFGQPAPAGGDRETHDEVIRTSAPVIGNVAVGPAIRTASVRIRVPVLDQGAVRYVLSVPLKLELFDQILREQRLPADWVIALADRHRRFIARIPPAPPGNPVSESFRAAIERAPEGWFRGRTVEGLETYTPYVTSAQSGWVLGIALPAATVEASVRRAAALMGAGVVAALALAFWLAWLFGHRISRPIASLARDGRLAPRDDASIDEIARLRDALAERNELAEREKTALRSADRAKDEFLAMLSHELRNPLAALTAAAHVLRLAPSQEAAQQARGVIERQTQHMARLIEDLLDVSRVAMGKIALERERFNLADMVYGAVSAWRAAGRFERHRVSVEVAPAWVDADRTRMEQVLSNLLDNSTKFTPSEGSIVVSVRPEGAHAVLQVTDDGEGLGAGMAERAFELFVQGEQGLDRGKGGMGIGLAVVKRIVDLHGGRVSAASEGTGQGTAFTVRLPSVPPPEKKYPLHAVSSASAEPRRILLVEDNDDARHMMGAALALNGHDVLEARDGASGLSAAADKRPDVALIDIGLPDMDGYELARRLRAEPQGRDVLLIAVTGYGQAQDQRRALDAGFDAHLTKPVAPDVLERTLRTVPRA